MSAPRHTGEEAAQPRPRSLGLLFAAIGLVFALWPLFAGSPPRWWLLALAGLLALVALGRPSWLLPAAKAWARLGQAMHWVVNPVVVAVLYFLVLTPVGLLRRLARRDPLALARDASRASYLTPQRRALDSEALKRQF